MSPRIFSCVLCGYIICNYGNLESASWIDQFRIRKDLVGLFYRETEELINLGSTAYSGRKGIAVIGVGIYNDPNAGEWIAPLNFTARWDDAGYSFPTRSQIGVLRQPRANGRHGLPLQKGESSF